MGKALNREASQKETIPCGRGSPRQPAVPELTCHTGAQVTVRAGGALGGWASGHLQPCCSEGERLPFLFLLLLKGAEVEGAAFRACWVNTSLVARAAVALPVSKWHSGVLPSTQQEGAHLCPRTGGRSR